MSLKLINKYAVINSQIQWPSTLPIADKIFVKFKIARKSFKTS